jgi:hypothetical protein
MDKIDWYNLCENSAAIEILKKNQNNICWTFASSNKSIFQYIDPIKLIRKTITIILT